MKKKTVLCINIGTPSSDSTSSVRAYLKEFLSDPRVLDIPFLSRQLLLQFLILPFRSPKSAKAYQSIWTKKGSPLLVESENFSRALGLSLGSNYCVRVAMRYGKPSLKEALKEASKAQEELIVFPLFPQYASSSTGSALDQVYGFLAKEHNVPPVKVIGSFYKERGFIDSLAEKVKGYQKETTWDHLLMSYHGLPEHQVMPSEKKEGDFCQSEEPCPVDFKETFCYRKQCYETSHLLAKSLDLSHENYTVSFQSRLGRRPWIKPYTDQVLPALRKAGVKKLAVLCPSFVSDCLETLEEISIRAREDWLKLGGTSFTFIPCLNDSKAWVDFCSDKIKNLS